MRHWLLLALLLAVVSPVFAQHGVNNRQQWPARTGKDGFDPDRRLEQPVKIEIVGHSAAVTMAKLSKLTGVSLGIAPEDLTTVGERKLAIFANKLTLKSLMVQIPKALQDCHWDIVESGKRPSYLLHSNSEANDEESVKKRREAGLRQALIEDVRRALAMSPEELAELEKTDLYLAIACREPQARSQLETFLSLSPAQLQEFAKEGGIKMPFSEASPQIQALAKSIAQQQGKPNSGSTDWTGQDIARGMADTANWAISYSNLTTLEDPEDRCVYINVDGKIRGQRMHLFQKMAVPSYGWFEKYSLGIWHQQLLVAGGMAEDAAKKLIEDASAIATSDRDAGWPGGPLNPRPEPTNPRLRVPLRLEVKLDQAINLTDIEQQIARRTGLSVVADYFTLAKSRPSSVAFQEMPLWRLLWRLGYEYKVEWQEAGDCLIFHHADNWSMLCRSEPPESIIAACRNRIRQGTFDLAYLVHLVRILPDEKLWWRQWPEDCQVIGLKESRWALELYGSLDAKQAKKARSTEGLPFAEMTPGQQKAMRTKGMTLQTPEQGIVASRFFIEEKTGPKWGAGWVTHTASLRLQFGDRQAVVGLRYNIPAPKKEK